MNSSNDFPWHILADDLTGACDTGAVFAARGWPVRVAISRSANSAPQVWSSESRGLNEDEAVQAVEHVLSGMELSEADYFYKKIDSTLRGHPGAELAPVLHWLGVDRALVCPAFPAQGRTVIQGDVLVNGTPLPETAYAPDAAETSLLRMCQIAPGGWWAPLEAVRQDVDRLAAGLSEPGIYAADAETQADLNTLARAGLQAGIRLFCGSAGLARALAEQLEPSTQPALPASETGIPQPGKALVVAGSRSMETARQVVTLAAAGWDIYALTEHDLSQGEAYFAKRAKTLAGHHNLALTIAGLADRAGDERRIAEALARWTAALLQRGSLGGLVLTGGDVAAAVCSALDCTAIDLGGEVTPGLAWGCLADGPYTGLRIVTKAGGFGGDEALLDAARFLDL